MSTKHQVDHTCHNRSGCEGGVCPHRRCCNPAHLEAVSQRTNISRGNAGAHHRDRTHCANDHEYTPENTIYPLRPNGKRNERVCRICRRDAQIRYNQKRKRAA